MGQEVDKREFSREDRTRYRAKVRRCLDVFARMLREARFEAGRPMTGIEIEFNLVDANGDPAMKNAEALEEIADPDFQTELGQFNLEINVPPRRLPDGGVSGFQDGVRASLNAAEDKAGRVGAHLMMIGILPSLHSDHLSADKLSANPRYAVLNDQILSARGEDIQISIDGVERLAVTADSILHEAACTSRSAPRTSRRIGTRRRRSLACRSRSVPTRRSCWARSCGARRGSHCSSRRPTPAARS